MESSAGGLTELLRHMPSTVPALHVDTVVSVLDYAERTRINLVS